MSENSQKTKTEQKLVDMRNLEDVNKLLASGFIFLTTVHTNDTVLALLEKKE
jgi:hypothetical protein